MVCKELRLRRHLHPVATRPRGVGTEGSQPAPHAFNGYEPRRAVLPAERNLQEHAVHYGLRLSAGQVQQRAGSTFQHGLQRPKDEAAQSHRRYVCEDASRLCEVYRRNIRTRLLESRTGADERMPPARCVFVQRHYGRPETTEQLYVRLARNAVLRRRDGRQAYEGPSNRQQHARGFVLPEDLYP